MAASILARQFQIKSSDYWIDISLTTPCTVNQLAAVQGFFSIKENMSFPFRSGQISDGDAFGFYLHGDTAPMGRFNYVYQPG